MFMTGFSAEWVVDSNSGHDADFTQLSLALADASVMNGDTIYVVGAGSTYTGFALDKAVHIYGPGVYLAQNPDTQASKLSARVDYINVRAGSSGATVSGLYIEELDIEENNVTFNRNRIWRIDADNASNITLSGCFMLQNNNSYASLDLNNGSIFVYNTLIRNSGSNDAIRMQGTSVGEFYNCVLYSDVIIQNAEFHNNIQISGTFSSSSSSVTHNIGHSTQFGTSDNNQENVDMNTVFVFSGSTDGYYQLAVGSPAIGAGIGSIDCGMFGGNSPYVLSCLPAIPAVYSALGSASGSTATGLQINIKVKSHD